MVGRNDALVDLEDVDQPPVEIAGLELRERSPGGFAAAEGDRGAATGSGRSAERRSDPIRRDGRNVRGRKQLDGGHSPPANRSENDSAEGGPQLPLK